MNPNVAFITAVVSVLAIVFSIFGASWLNQRATERAVDALRNHVDQRISDLEKRLDERFKAVDQRFSSLEQRIERIERQLETLFKPITQPRS